ncbi:MAG: hypothetical protein HOV79_17640 [Hamadaea sp.]|nr:hypothetical protein [Hamadaea sp.]
MTEQHETVRAEQVPVARTASEPITPQPVEAPEPLPRQLFAGRDAGGGRPKRSRRWWLAMTGSILGCGVIAAGVTLGPTSYRMWTQKDATLSTPPQAAGLTLDTTEAAKTAAGDLRTVLDAGFALDATVAGVYGDPTSAAKSVLFAGGTGFFARPERELDQVFTLLDDQAGVTDVRTVDPGSLGGVMRCGAAEGSEAVLTICGWADHGSVAFAMFPGRTLDESAPLLRDLRGAVLKR